MALLSQASIIKPDTRMCGKCGGSRALLKHNATTTVNKSVLILNCHHETLPMIKSRLYRCLNIGAIIIYRMLWYTVMHSRI